MFDISADNGVVKVFRSEVDSYGRPMLVAYAVSEFKKYAFDKDAFTILIGGDTHKCLFTDLTIAGNAPYDFDQAHEWLSEELDPCCAVAEETTGASGAFTTTDGFTVTVTNGLITEITGGM